MKLISPLAILPLLIALTACNQEQSSDSRSISKKEVVEDVAAGSTNYLDFKNGFRDVTFGQRIESVKDLVLVREEKINGNTLSGYKRGTDILSLDEVQLTKIIYIFLNSELAAVTIEWDRPYTNVVEYLYPNIPASTGIKGRKFSMGWPTGLEKFAEKLYGTPSRFEIKDKPSEPGKEVNWRRTTVEWFGKKVRLDFYESQSSGLYPDKPATTYGSIQIADIQRRNKMEELVKLSEANEVAKKKDGL